MRLTLTAIALVCLPLSLDAIGKGPNKEPVPYGDGCFTLRDAPADHIFSDTGEPYCPAKPRKHNPVAAIQYPVDSNISGRFIFASRTRDFVLDLRHCDPPEGVIVPETIQGFCRARSEGDLDLMLPNTSRNVWLYFEVTDSRTGIDYTVSWGHDEDGGDLMVTALDTDGDSVTDAWVFEPDTLGPNQGTARLSSDVDGSIGRIFMQFAAEMKLIPGGL